MKIILNRINEEYLLEAKNDSGHTVIMDNKTLENPKGASPMELLIMGLSGCNAIDIISILKKKKQKINSYRTEVKAEREKNVVPALFKSAHLTIYIEGEISKESVLSAAKLSFDKYCSVSRILEKTMRISYAVILNGEKI